MVLLATTSKGLVEAIAASKLTGESVWCGAEAVSAEDFAMQIPKNVTRFTYGLQGDNAELLQDAIGTIAEHHPGQTIWVEAAPSEA